MIPFNKIYKKLPISEYQKRFFLEWAVAPHESTYNISVVYKISGKLNVDVLKRACEEFFKCNEVLHSRYTEDGEECFNIDYAPQDYFFSDSLDANIDIELKVREILKRPFDLTKDVLCKFYLLANPKKMDEHYFIINSHHIVADGVASVHALPYDFCRL